MGPHLPAKELLTENNSKEFWNVLGRALRAEPRDGSVIKGSIWQLTHCAPALPGW